VSDNIPKRIEAGDVELFDRTDFDCPFCQLLVSFGILLNGPQEIRGSEVVMHKNPACLDFSIHEDPTTFLQIALNKLKEKHRNRPSS
jgi:hypothetical protein